MQFAAMAAANTGVREPRLIFPMAVARACAPLATAAVRLAARRPIYTSVSLRALESNHSISHARATCELGYHPRPLEETNADTLRWFRENGRLRP